MMTSPHVLLVAPTTRIAAVVRAGLIEAGVRLTLVTSFRAARQALDSHPDLLISEVRLGEFNGLHLALRAHSRGIRSIVIGAMDSVTQREAAALGADYLEDNGDVAQLHSAVRAAGSFPRRISRVHAA